MNVNMLIIAGNLCRDPQLSYLPSQTPVVEFSVATNRTFKKTDGSKGEEAAFVEVKAFGKVAENLNKYFKKGSPIFLIGRVKFDSWTGKDGSKRSKLYMMAENFQFVGSSSTGDSGASQGQRESSGSQPQQDDDPPF